MPTVKGLPRDDSMIADGDLSVTQEDTTDTTKGTPYSVIRDYVLSPGNVGTAALANDAATKAKIADDAIGTDQLDTDNTGNDGQIVSKQGHRFRYINPPSGTGGVTLDQVRAEMKDYARKDMPNRYIHNGDIGDRQIELNKFVQGTPGKVIGYNTQGLPAELDGAAGIVTVPDVIDPDGKSNSQIYAPTNHDQLRYRSPQGDAKVLNVHIGEGQNGFARGWSRSDQHDHHGNIEQFGDDPISDGLLRIDYYPQSRTILVDIDTDADGPLQNANNPIILRYWPLSGSYRDITLDQVVNTSGPNRRSYQTTLPGTNDIWPTGSEVHFRFRDSTTATDDVHWRSEVMVKIADQTDLAALEALLESKIASRFQTVSSKSVRRTAALPDTTHSDHVVTHVNITPIDDRAKVVIYAQLPFVADRNDNIDDAGIRYTLKRTIGTGTTTNLFASDDATEYDYREDYIDLRSGEVQEIRSAATIIFEDSPNTTEQVKYELICNRIRANVTGATTLPMHLNGYTLIASTAGTGFNTNALITIADVNDEILAKVKEYALKGNRAISGDDIANQGIERGKYAVGSIQEADIRTGAIHSAQIADQVLLQRHFTSNSIPQGALRSNSVLTSNIANGQITNSKMASNSVGTHEIIDESVLFHKLRRGTAGKWVKFGPDGVLTETDEPQGGNTPILPDNVVTKQKISKYDYDQLDPPDEDTMYVIPNLHGLYLGEGVDGGNPAKLHLINRDDPDSSAGDYGQLGELPGISRPIPLYRSDTRMLIMDQSNHHIHQIDYFPGDITVQHDLGTPHELNSSADVRAAFIDDHGDIAIVSRLNNFSYVHICNPDDPTDGSGDYGLQSGDLLNVLDAGIDDPRCAYIKNGKGYIVNAEGSSTPATLWHVNFRNPPDLSGSHGLVGSGPSNFVSPQAATVIDNDTDTLFINRHNGLDSLWELDEGDFDNSSGNSDGYVGRIIHSINDVDGITFVPEHGTPAAYAGKILLGQATVDDGSNITEADIDRRIRHLTDGFARTDSSDKMPGSNIQTDSITATQLGANSVRDQQIANQSVELDHIKNNGSLANKYLGWNSAGVASALDAPAKSTATEIRDALQGLPQSPVDQRLDASAIKNLPSGGQGISIDAILEPARSANPDLAWGVAKIPNLNANKITSGTLGTARIPDLNASKITAGTIDTDRLGGGTADNTTVLYGDNQWRPLAGGSGHLIHVDNSNISTVESGNNLISNITIANHTEAEGDTLVFELRDNISGANDNDVWQITINGGTAVNVHWRQDDSLENVQAQYLNRYDIYIVQRTGNNWHIVGGTTNGVRPFAKIGGRNIQASDLATGSVVRAKIQGNAVNEEKIEIGAVTENRIADDAVSRTKIRNNAVQTEHIDSGAVESDKIADNAIHLGHLEHNTGYHNKYISWNAAGNPEVRDLYSSESTYNWDSSDGINTFVSTGIISPTVDWEYMNLEIDDTPNSYAPTIKIRKDALNNLDTITVGDSVADSAGKYIRINTDTGHTHYIGRRSNTQLVWAITDTGSNDATLRVRGAVC